MDTMRSAGTHRAAIELDEVKVGGVYEKMDKRNVNEHTYDHLEREKKTQTENTSKENMDKTKVVIAVLCVVVTALVVTVFAVVTVGLIVYFGATDGSWTDWDDWRECSETCGVGFRTRIRTCSNPRPSILGHYCVGTSVQIQTCNNSSCSGNTIGFSVHRPYSNSGGHPLTFHTALYNSNDVFNMTSGEFVCKQEGLYFFTNTLLRTTGTISTIECSFHRNNNPSIGYGSYASSNNTDDNPSSTTSILYHLKPGDRVYLGSCVGMKYMARGSSFTGFLISPEY